MADKAQQLLLDALQRAAGEPGGMPLFGSKTAAGWFANNATGKQAALACRERGLLRVVRTETKGKTSLDICTISEEGLQFLLQQHNPRQVLEAILAALENRRAELHGLHDAVRVCQEHLDALKKSTEQVLQHLQQKNAPPAATNGKPEKHLGEDVVQHLGQWQASGNLDDCPLPKLFSLLHARHQTMTIGQFQDALRRLHEESRVYLHPWTGPLYQLPEPAFALLVGHEIAYYASLRS